MSFCFATRQVGHVGDDQVAPCRAVETRAGPALRASSSSSPWAHGSAASGQRRRRVNALEVAVVLQAARGISCPAAGGNRPVLRYQLDSVSGTSALPVRGTGVQLSLQQAMQRAYWRATPSGYFHRGQARARAITAILRSVPSSRPCRLACQHGLRRPARSPRRPCAWAPAARRPHQEVARAAAGSSRKSCRLSASPRIHQQAFRLRGCAGRSRARGRLAGVAWPTKSTGLQCSKKSTM